MEFKAIGNKVVAKVIIESAMEEKKSDAGIVLIGKKETGLDVNTVEAVVTSVGEGMVNPKTGEFIPVPLAVGDRIVINGAVGAKLDATHRVINVDDIFAKIM